MRKKRWLYYTFLQSLGVPVIYVAFRLLTATLRIKWINRHYWEELLAEGKPIIYAFWHEDLVVPSQLGRLASRYRKISIMTSLSRDGEVLSKLLRWLGFAVVRGSSSRGAVRGIIHLKRSIQSGNSVAVAVDGPRGPRHVVKPGVVLLGKLTGAAILPFTIRLRRKKILNSWDRCEVPFPFSRGEVEIYTPIQVPDDADDRKIEEIRLKLEQTLLDGKASPPLNP